MEGLISKKEKFKSKMRIRPNMVFWNEGIPHFWLKEARATVGRRSQFWFDSLLCLEFYLIK